MINEFIMLILTKTFYAYELNLNDILEIKTKLNLYLKF